MCIPNVEWKATYDLGIDGIKIYIYVSSGKWLRKFVLILIMYGVRLRAVDL